MTVWAISDLHLSLAGVDRRERYAERWRGHAERLAKNWRETVAADDLVLLPGDISMARGHRDLQPDLRWLEALPGTKVLAPGNHDRWWNDVAKIRPMLRSSLRAVDGDALSLGGVIVAGSRSSAVPRSDDPADPSRAQAARSLDQLNAALDAADAVRTDAEQPLFVLWHFPPFDAYGRPGPWVEVFEVRGVTACLYGHLHTESQWTTAVQGRRGSVWYQCVAADAIGFRPLRVAPR